MMDANQNFFNFFLSYPILILLPPRLIRIYSSPVPLNTNFYIHQCMYTIIPLIRARSMITSDVYRTAKFSCTYHNIVKRSGLKRTKKGF